MKVNTIQHPKLLRLKRRLALNTWMAVGILETLWHFTAIHCKDGAIGRTFTDEDIANAIDWDGEPGELIEALVSSGWLDRCGVNRLVIHDWQDHCPDFVRANLGRLKSDFAVVKTEQVMPIPNANTYTQQVMPIPNANTNTKPQDLNQNQNQTNTPFNSPTGGKPPTKSFNPKSIPIPEELDTQEFRKAWADWCDFRSEIKRGLNPNSVKRQIAFLAGLGPSVAAQSINESIRNGYRGLFEPKPKFSNGPPGRPVPDTRPMSERIAEHRAKRAATEFSAGKEIEVKVEPMAMLNGSVRHG